MSEEFAISDIIMGRVPDGEYEDEHFTYSVKDGKLTMTGKPLKEVFIYDKRQVPGQV